MGRIVCCHQPDLFPWLGLFWKIAISDSFVVLDEVTANPKDGQNWIRRVMIEGEQGDGSSWLSLPVEKSRSNHGKGIKIAEWKYNRRSENWSKAWERVKRTYGKRRHYQEIEGALKRFFEEDGDSLVDKNMRFIDDTMKLLGITTQVCHQSQLEVEGGGNEMLVNATRAVGGDTYVSGDGASGYLVEDFFREQRVTLRFSRFLERMKELDSDYEGMRLSIVDGVANNGLDRCRSIIKKALK